MILGQLRMRARQTKNAPPTPDQKWRCYIMPWRKYLYLEGGSNISVLQTLKTSRFLFPYRCKLICFCRKRKSTRLKWARSRLHIRRRNRNLADTSISVPFNDRLVLCLPCDKKMSISRDLKSHVWVIHRLGLFSPRLSHVNLSLSTEPSKFSVIKQASNNQLSPHVLCLFNGTQLYVTHMI